jgi:lysozyme family protein
MRANFEACLSLVLRHEGGWSDHPRDPGGATMKGVTLATYTDFLGRPATKAELKAIPDQHLETIYWHGYWVPCRCDDLAAGLDYAVFDAAVNSGPKRAAQWLQRVAGAVVDGQVGPATLAAVNKLEPAKAIESYCDVRLRFLMSLSTWPTFGKGLLRRVAEVLRDARVMASS